MISGFLHLLCVQISIYFTSVEGWGNFKKVFGIRTYMYMTLQKLCSQLGITYQEPLLPVHVTSSCATTQSSALTLQTDPSARKTFASPGVPNLFCAYISFYLNAS